MKQQPEQIEFIAIMRNKRKIVMAFNRYEISLYFDVQYLLWISENKPFIEINNKTDISFNKRQLKNSVNKFIEIGLLKITKQKDIYRVSRAFMWYGTEPI